MTSFTEFTGKNGKRYRARYKDGCLDAIEQWRCASYRTGRYHWVLVWPRWSNPHADVPIGVRGEVPPAPPPEAA